MNHKKHLNVPASKLPVQEEVEGDFRSSFHWRIFRIMAEFVDGWQFHADFKKTVTFFGSARTPETDHWYKEAQSLGKLLANEGYSVVTGGGPGIMEAGNRGAFEAREESGTENGGIGESIGFNIKLPHEQRINQYVNKPLAFYYLFVRKVMLSYYAQAYVYFPGGFGTCDEFFEIITLVQVKKVPRIPIILVGKEFWAPIDKWIKEDLARDSQFIDKEDSDLYVVVDSAEEAFEKIKKSPQRKVF